MNSLKEIETFVSKNFGRFGINKSREITRLIFEISKRDNPPLITFSKLSTEKNFSKIKSFLLKTRFPENFQYADRDSFYLPKVVLDPVAKALISKSKFYPRNIYVEQTVVKNPLAERISGFFPRSKAQTIPSIKDFLKDCRFDLKDYNIRTDSLFLINEKYDFYKTCPCTSNVLPCGYSLLNLGFGCPFECSYCFLQGYQNVPGMIIPANLEKFFEEFSPPKKTGSVFPYARIGTGEFTDSLVFDDLTGYSTKLIEFFSRFPEVIFEFKTKSSNIKNLLSARPQKNIVISWSLNPQSVIDKHELLTASLEERISSAKQCAESGFGVGFHFDPIFYFKGWEKEYFKVIEMIFSAVSPEKVYWISLGTLRMPKELKKSIENRFPDADFLNGELLLGRDGKLRYPQGIRQEIYRKMSDKIRGHSSKTIVYLCMEPADVWKDAGLRQ